MKPANRQLSLLPLTLRYSVAGSVLPSGYPRPASNNFAAPRHYLVRGCAHSPVSATFPLLPCYSRSLSAYGSFSKGNISPAGTKQGRAAPAIRAPNKTPNPINQKNRLLPRTPVWCVGPAVFFILSFLTSPYFTPEQKTKVFEIMYDFS